MKLMHVDQLAIAHINGEEYGVKITEVVVDGTENLNAIAMGNDPKPESVWYKIKTLEYISHYDREFYIKEVQPGETIREVFKPMDYVDYEGEPCPADIFPGKALIMRADVGKLGIDNICLGSGNSVANAIADTLVRFETNEGSWAKATPEALATMSDERLTWRSEDRKIQYYVKFYQDRSSK